MTSPLPVREPIQALNRINLDECAEPLVDLRIAYPDLFINQAKWPYLRQGVANRLAQAASTLSPEYRLVVHCAYRPLEEQKKRWKAYRQQLQGEHPTWPLATLNRETNRYYAPYDQPAPPGHCTGGAVDVLLADQNGQIIPLSPAPGFRHASTHLRTIPAAMQELRQRLFQAMLQAGFSNCSAEYWHYSYGDAAWAVRTGHSECCYGLVEGEPRPK